jgi:hypothetical protein
VADVYEHSNLRFEVPRFVSRVRSSGIGHCADDNVTSSFHHHIVHQASPKLWYLSAKLYGVTRQKTVMTVNQASGSIIGRKFFKYQSGCSASQEGFCSVDLLKF